MLTADFLSANLLPNKIQPWADVAKDADARFAFMGCIDAPDVIAAGSHNIYRTCETIDLIMPTFISRD